MAMMAAIMATGTEKKANARIDATRTILFKFIN